MTIDLKLLEQRIDKWLNEETEESIREWLLAQRKEPETSDEAVNIADVVGQSEQLAIQRCECEHCDPTEIKVCTNCDGYVE